MPFLFQKAVSSVSFLKSVEQDYDVPVIKYEEYPEDIASIFSTDLIELFTQILYELAAYPFLYFQHIKNIVYLTGFLFLRDEMKSVK